MTYLNFFPFCDKIISYRKEVRYMLHIYCGDGKGKTTAAAGLAVRASGAGIKCFFFQFLKNGDSSEIEQMKKLGIQVRSCTGARFTRLMTDEEKKLVTLRHDEMLSEACELVRSGKAGLIVLDELLAAYSLGLADRELTAALLDMKDSAEIIVTGRGPDDIFLSKADYITHMAAVKHPYTKGIQARKGIEY